MQQAYVEIMSRIEVPLKATVDLWLGEVLRMGADSFGSTVTVTKAIQEALDRTPGWRDGRRVLLYRLLRVVPVAVAVGRPLNPDTVLELQSLAAGCV